METQSLNVLTTTEQRILSEDQKHSSAVAKGHYQEHRSGEVAVKAHEGLQKLQGAKGSEVDKDVNARFADSTLSLGASGEATESKDCPVKRILCPITRRLVQRKVCQVLRFTENEDCFLWEGIKKHGFGQWTAILRDCGFTFQEGRVADSLKKRVQSKFL